jgi:hypothetical protein
VVRTLLETIRTFDATPLRHLSDVHVVATSQEAIAYLCYALAGEAAGTVVRAVLPVGLEEQLDALAASGLVGRLQVTVVHLGDEVHLLAKTHAGSAAERASWRRSLA